MTKQYIKFYAISDNTEYKLRKSRYKKIRTLGEGSFGKIILVEKINPTKENSLKKKNPKYYALKIPRKFKIISITNIQRNKQISLR